MRKAALFILEIIFFSFLIPFIRLQVLAGDLGTLIRLDRTVISTSTGGLVCATPESTGIETHLQIVFPTGFTVNQTASNWTVTTTNLPAGAVAMPGINTASGVSGQIVTFPINDLSTGTQYCFNFSSTNTLTTPSSTGTYVGILRTMNSSNQVVDYHAFGISIVNNDSINVTATVAAQPTDFDAFLTLTQPTNGTFPHNTTLTYTLKYGNKLSYPADITVEASWDLGTISGNLIPTVNLLDYVIGSATNAYNNSPPVIDIINRKINWTISAIPGNTTNKTVSFKLKTNNSYTGLLPVSFSVKGRTYGPGTVTPDSSVTSQYLYPSPNTKTPTPGSNSGSSSSDTSAISTPTPTSITPLANPVINDIQIRTVSSSEATILVTTHQLTTIKLQYGTSIKTLSKTFKSNNLGNKHLVKLSDLSPATRYYFRVIATNQNGDETVSDIYVFDTATPSIPPKILSNLLIVTSNDVVLTDPLRINKEKPVIVIPVKTPYSFKFAVEGYEKIKSIKAIVRNKNVLGLASFQTYASSDYVEITEIAPGEYIGKLQSKDQPGSYNLVIQIHDFNGNISEQDLLTIKAVTPFRIINSKTKKPIENAKVFLSFFNPRLKIYEPLSSDITPVKNPNYSEADGHVPIVIPTGKYKAEVTAIGYEEKTVEFEIGPQSLNYLTVELTMIPFSVISYAKYTASTANDVLFLIKNYIHTLRTSLRFFDLIAFLVVFLLVFLSTVSFSRRLSVPLNRLPYFCLYFLSKLLRQKPDAYPLHGKVTTLNGEVVPGSVIYFSTPKGKIITHTTSNSDGEFFANIHEASTIQVTVTKKGYKATVLTVAKDSLDKKIEVNVVALKKPEGFGFEVIHWYASYLSGALFETILILTLIVELLFTLEFGILKVLPFIAISLTNIFLWAANARATRS